MRTRVLTILSLLILTLATAGADQVRDLRGDEGVLMDLRPTGVEWLSKDRLFVVDQRWNAMHIFDTEGRRFRFIEFPRMIGPAFYAGTAHYKDNEYYVTGNHYHEKNNQRYLQQRAVIHKVIINGEELGAGSVEENYSPDMALRKTRLFGSTPTQQMEISGIAMDEKHNRLFLGLARPLTEKGTILMLTGPLDEFLERKESMEFDLLDTGIKPPTEPACGTQFYLSDIEYVPDRGVVCLLTAEASGGHRFCSNQIWFLKGGFGPGKMIRQELAPGNRATGIALMKVGDFDYKVAMVCDNDPEETKIPSRLIILDEPIRLQLR
ncbi:MAG: hypothetical protein KC910_29250 [Candidatus Eremiobacteraeota bacterium]|nr:hypothetical protein [Candidatus Eremiobacteraeota bacterium]